MEPNKQPIQTTEQDSEPIESVPLEIRETTSFFFSDSDNRVIGFTPEANGFFPISVSTSENDMIFDYSAVVQREDSMVFILGGINKEADMVSNLALCFDPNSKKLSVIAPMQVNRYSATALILNNQLYVIGGRSYGTDQDALLRQCERYDFQTQQWYSIAPMKEKRCSHFSFIYKGEIWVMGGYTDRMTRSTVIEKYNPQSGQWSVLPFKLQNGVESGHIDVTGPDTVMIFGGTNGLGATNQCHEINLALGTIINKGIVPFPLTIGKLVRAGNRLLVFGNMDDGNYGFQAFNHLLGLWEELLPKNYEILSRGFKPASNSQHTMVVPTSGLSNPLSLPADVVARSQFLFGTDDEPYIVRIDREQLSVDYYPVPLGLRLKNFQSVCRVAPNLIFFNGGANLEQTKAFRNTYLFNLQNFSVIDCPPSWHSRFACGTAFLNGWVYVMGGRGLGSSDQAVINRVEKFNLNKGTWHRAPSMNYSRSAFTSVVHNGQILVAGGLYPDDTTMSSIEVFNPSTEIWTNIQTPLPIQLEACLSLINPVTNEWLIMGGRTEPDFVDTIYAAQLPKQNAPANSQTAIEFSRKSVLVEARALPKGFFNQNHLIVFGGTSNAARFAEVLRADTLICDDAVTEEFYNNLTSVLCRINFNFNELKPANLV